MSDEIARRPSDGKDVRAVGFFNYLRQLEQRAGDVPRIGQNTTLAQEVVTIGQDPSMAFPEADFLRMDTDKRGKPAVRNQIIGFFGGQGALPLDMTEEVYRWTRTGDYAYVHFTDIFATRFQQLYFRAWSDSRAITQFDHPTQDRFATYVGALVGLGTKATQNRDTLEDINKLALAPLAVGRVKSPVKLQQMLQQDLGAKIHVEEFVPSWIMFEADSLNALGGANSSLGRNMFLGARAQSVDDKICLNIATGSGIEYRSFLPGGESHSRLTAIVSWYLGVNFDVTVALTMPADAIAKPVVGKTMELGWMAALEPANKPPPDTQVPGASYTLKLTA